MKTTVYEIFEYDGYWSKTHSLKHAVAIASDRAIFLGEGLSEYTKVNLVMIENGVEVSRSEVDWQDLYHNVFSGEL